MIDLWRTFISVYGNKQKLIKESRGHIQSTEIQSLDEIWTIGSRNVVGRRLDKSRNAKSRFAKERYGPLDQGRSWTVNLARRSLEFRSSEKGGELTCEFVKREVPKFLYPSHSQGHINEE
jgi:hypothetical protein